MVHTDTYNGTMSVMYYALVLEWDEKFYWNSFRYHFGSDASTTLLNYPSN